jgi:hypothetical protein
MCDDGGGDSTQQIGGDIPFRPAGGNGVTKNPPAVTLDFMRRVQRSLSFNFPQHSKELR